MPTYDDLRGYFEERRHLREIAGGVSRNPIVTGITLHIDPYWALIHDVSAGLADPRTIDVVRYLEYSRLLPHASGFGYFVEPEVGPWNALFPAYQGFRRRDLYRKFEVWEKIAQGWK